jgi:DNA-binding Xre family transcriptional regulator
MTPSAKSETAAGAATASPQKAAAVPMMAEFKRSVIAQATDDVIAKLTGAFFEVAKNEKWGKRDLSQISGMNETAIGHILSGRRKNLTVETIALLARAMQKRPELVLHDTRPKGNKYSAAEATASVANRPFSAIASSTAASALVDQNFQQYPKASAVQFSSTEPQSSSLISKLE